MFALSERPDSAREIQSSRRPQQCPSHGAAWQLPAAPLTQPRGRGLGSARLTDRKRLPISQRYSYRYWYRSLDCAVSSRGGRQFDRIVSVALRNGRSLSPNSYLYLYLCVYLCSVLRSRSFRRRASGPIVSAIARRSLQFEPPLATTQCDIGLSSAPRMSIRIGPSGAAVRRTVVRSFSPAFVIGNIVHTV